MIQSFRDSRAARLFRNERVKELRNVEDSARTRLIRLDAAERLEDLAALKGNRLETLKGDRKGQHSIRIDDQYRICFTWGQQGPENVEISDYH